MGVLTNLLKLLKPGENDYYNQQTEQADNWDKVDDYAVLTNTDKNGIWGGEYGGKIQDPIPKELNKRYIDNINGKAFICIKAGDSSVVSNTIEYFTPCNVVDNSGKLQSLNHYYYNSCVGGDLFNDSTEFNFKPISVLVSSALKKFKVPYEGLYFVNFSSRLSGDGTTKDVLIKIQKNDKDVAILPTTTISSSVTATNYDDSALTVSCVLYLSTNDVVGLFTTQNKFNQQSLSICRLR